MHKYHSIFKAFTVKWLKPFRKTKNLSQEQMAEQLRISPRSYLNLEKGKCWLSACSLIFLLLSMSTEEVWNFLEELRKLVKGSELKTMK